MVGASASHHVVRIGNGNDASAKGDLHALEAVRIPESIPALVMMLDRLGPGPKPRNQRGDQLHAVDRVLMDLLPVLWGERPVLVEDLGRYLELSDVVEQSSPAEPISVVTCQAHFLGEHVGVGAGALGVTPCLAVVLGQGRREREDYLGRLRQCRVTLESGCPAPQSRDVAGPSGHPQP